MSDIKPEALEDGVVLLSTPHPGSTDPDRATGDVNKYRIEVERIDDSTRPWEWRVYCGDELCITGAKATAAAALDEAVITLGL